MLQVAAATHHTTPFASIPTVHCVSGCYGVTARSANGRARLVAAYGRLIACPLRHSAFDECHLRSVFLYAGLWPTAGLHISHSHDRLGTESRHPASRTPIFHRDGRAVDDVVPSVNDRPRSNFGEHPPLHLVGPNAEALGVNGYGAELHAIYRQLPEVRLLPANPHECTRIAAKFTVRADFELTVKRRQRIGVKF